MKNNSELIIICQKAYLLSASENIDDDFLMCFDEIEVMKTIRTTKAFAYLENDLYTSYTDPVKAFRKPMLDLGFIAEEFDRPIGGLFMSRQYITDKGIRYLESLKDIEIEYNDDRRN